MKHFRIAEVSYNSFRSLQQQTAQMLATLANMHSRIGDLSNRSNYRHIDGGEELAELVLGKHLLMVEAKLQRIQELMCALPRCLRFLPLRSRCAPDLY